MQINLELLKDLNDSEKITLWNEYQSEISSDSQIYDNDEDFFHIYFAKAIDAVRAAHYGEYNYSDTYVSFDGYANLESFNDVDNQIDFDDLSDWLEEDPDSYQGYDIWEEEEEE